VVAALDVVVAWALWLFFDRVHHAVAVLAAWCRGLYAAGFAVGVSHLVAAARLLGDSQSHEPTETRVANQVGAEIQQFYDIWSLGLGSIRGSPTADRLAGAHLRLRSATYRRPGRHRRCRLPGGLPRRSAVHDVRHRDCLFHLRWRGRTDGLAVGVCCAQQLPVR
jgi:hypothetical protein